MRLKLLLFILLISGGVLQAQDTIRTLIISEALVYRADYNYIELTNVGDDPIDMSNFKLGQLGPWSGPNFEGTNEEWLPAVTLAPGESYVIATVLDFTEKMHPIDPDHFGPRVTPEEMWELADWQIHRQETNSIPGVDSISPNFDFMTVWDGRDGWYIEQHLSDIDSVVVDQVNGWFDDDGVNFNQAYDVAGVSEATVNSVLVRRFDVKQGNPVFVYGNDIADSEWIPVPLAMEDESQLPWRSPFWTVGNHGDYNLDENTLVSDMIDVDLVTKVITVPWGTRQYDDLVEAFDKTEGLGWYYHLSEAREDSAFVSARTGDQLTLYVCGLDADIETFDIVVAEPTADANVVLPKHRTQADGYYNDNMRGGNGAAYKVTDGIAGMDSISNGLFGIGYATRADSLLFYLEKAPKASWEFVWVDGVARTDVKTGDILKVTAENGDVKEYYIKCDIYRPNHNAYLSSITWPDIPEWLKGIFGWTGDTIPNFVNTSYNYKVTVPLGVDGIPGLTAKGEQLNTKVSVNRAASLTGTQEQQTITFTATAEDDTTTNVYAVQLIKELNPVNLQPYYAEPFIAEVVFQDMWGNGFVEIANPGNQYLDLSNYMLVADGSQSPAAAIEGYSGVDDWGARYRKYVPGYKWVDDASWAVNPGTLVQDLNVSPLVAPGDVFVGGDIRSDWGWNADFPGPIKQCDVIVNTGRNPWDESYDEWASAFHEWTGGNYILLKILNDSIKMGLKAANDPLDFEVIDIFGMGDGTEWTIGGDTGFGGPQCMTFIRKPQYSKGRTQYKESFGTTQEDSEWFRYDPAYWEARGIGWALNILNDTKDIGQHFMNAVTSYKSTVSSIVYKVSPGYTMEDVKGITTGTTVDVFLSNLIKADENQALKVKALADGSELAMDAILSANDTLVVLSADSTNMTYYVLDVSDAGLSSNAVITSSKYVVEIQVDPKSAGNEDAGEGTVAGFEYGTSLKTVVANITVPAGASYDLIDGNGAYVPLQRLNFDTAYVNVTVNDNTFISVTAENGVTTIVYQLTPDVTESTAFLTSEVYSVVQKDILIRYVPRGTNAQTFVSNLVASVGATMKLVDKFGAERMDGTIADDDKVVVTSPNGETVKAYYISMLAEEYIPETTYLAYINSKVYGVDQVDYMVNGVSGTSTIADFYSKITPAMGATAVVVDMDGVEKTTGDIDGTDMVKVTSADGKIVVMYSFGQLVSAGSLEVNNIELYPNPTNGVLNISGVERGNRIQVYNATGAAIRDINVQSSLETVSLHGEPSGMYLIVISNQNELLGRYKAIKK